MSASSAAAASECADLTASVGYIGLGNIGEPIATRILDAGFRTLVWNRTVSKSRGLSERGAEIATSPAEIASRCKIVCLCLTNVKAVEAVVFGPDGLATQAGSMRLLIDNSTIHPGMTRKMADRLHQMTGSKWLDCPVSGGPVGAKAGTLTAMVGGDAEDLAAARNVIASYAGRISHMGPVGCGQVAKACNQVIGFATMAAIAEALVLAQRSGIPMEVLPQSLAGGFADSNVLREYLRATTAREAGGIAVLVRALVDARTGMAGDRYRGRFSLLLKDIAIAADLGLATGTQTPMADLIARLYRDAGEEGAP